MKCNCVEKINEKLREQTGDPEASISVMFGVDLSSMVYIPYNYRTKKKDGTFSQKEKEGKLALNKCPFCG